MVLRFEIPLKAAVNPFCDLFDSDFVHLFWSRKNAYAKSDEATPDLGGVSAWELPRSWIVAVFSDCQASKSRKEPSFGLG